MFLISALKFKFMKFFSRNILRKKLRFFFKSHSFKGKRVLNIGCGGEFGTLIKNKSNCITLDIDFLKKPEIRADVTGLPFSENCFDYIFFLEVLEHTKNPFDAIREIHRVLKKNGLLIISVPFIFPEHDIPYDYFRFTRYGILELLSGFEIEEFYYRSDFIHTIIILLTRLQNSEYKNDRYLGCIFILFVIIFYPMLFLISKFIRTDFLSSGFFIVAKKEVK